MTIELYNETTERNVLGAILIDGMSIASIADILKTTDFYRDKHSWVYEACLNLFNIGEHINEVTVNHELSRLNRLGEIGAAFTSGLIAECATSVGIESYAKIVAEFSYKRALLVASKQIEGLAYGDDIEKSYGDALGLLLNLKMASSKDRLISPEESAEYAFNLYSEIQENQKDTLISFGLPCLDQIGGMQGGEVIVVSGATGHGKTTFANQVFRNVFKKYGFVLYVSLEQPQKQDMHLNMARITKEYVLKIQRGYYDEQLYGRIIGEGVNQVRNERVYRYFPINRTLPNIYAAARRVQAKVGLELVVIDYIQLLDNMRGVGSNMLEERMSNISRNIKYMAMDLNVPILALSRMTRDTNNEDINRLYGSGSIEYDADWVIFIKGDIEKNKGTLTVAKHRMGGMKGKFALSYSWETQEYSEDKTGGLE